MASSNGEEGVQQASSRGGRREGKKKEKIFSLNFCLALASCLFSLFFISVVLFLNDSPTHRSSSPLLAKQRPAYDKVSDPRALAAVGRRRELALGAGERGMKGGAPPLLRSAMSLSLRS